jgi:L-lactate dehydrogenase complex protein LldG
MKGDRDKILARIREGLAVPAPLHHEMPARVGQPAQEPAFRAWLPPVGASSQEQMALFAKQSELLRTEFVQCPDPAAAAAHVAGLAAALNWKKLAYHPGSLTAGLVPHLPPNLEQMRVEEGYDKLALEACDAGITECEFLVAQTGSVCVTARSSGGRALSVLPPHHLVIATRDQLVADLSAAYAGLNAKYGAALPSFISFISGPSRTGDIERILVLGAHGPKKLTVLVVG